MNKQKSAVITRALDKTTYTQDYKDNEVFEALYWAKELMLVNRPDDKSEKDKIYSITLTELRKVIAHFYTYIIMEEKF